MVWEKYTFVKSLDLHEILKTKSIGQLAKELSEETGLPYLNLHSSITWRVNRYFTEEERKSIKKDKNKRRKWEIDRDNSKI